MINKNKKIQGKYRVCALLITRRVVPLTLCPQQCPSRLMAASMLASNTSHSLVQNLYTLEVLRLNNHALSNMRYMSLQNCNIKQHKLHEFGGKCPIKCATPPLWCTLSLHHVLIPCPMYVVLHSHFLNHMC